MGGGEHTARAALASIASRRCGGMLQASHAGGRMAPRIRLSYPGANEGTP